MKIIKAKEIAPYDFMNSNYVGEEIYKVMDEASQNRGNINKKLYFSLNDIKIYNDDFLETKFIEQNSIDLVVTSPPLQC